MRQAAEGRVLDSRRARERAEAARVALGIGGRKPAPPRRPSQHDGDTKAQAPRRPSARAGSPAGVGLNDRGGGGGGGDRSPAGGGAEGVTPAGRRDREGGVGAGRGRGRGAGVRAEGVVGSNLGVEMDAALELARRRRAARALFGLGGGDEDDPNAPPVQLEDKQVSNLEVKSSRPDRPIPDNVVATPSPSRRAEAKPLVPTPPREPLVEPEERRLPSGSKQGTDGHHDDNRLRTRTPAPATEEGDFGGSKQEMGPVGEGAGDVALPDGRRRRGQAQQQHEAVSVAGPPTTPPLQAEQKGSSYDDCCDASFEGRGGGVDGYGSVLGGKVGASAAIAAPENEIKAGGSCRDEATGQQEEDPAAGHRCFSSDIPSEVGVEVADDGGGEGEVRNKVDLGVEDGWFEKFEAKMGAIKKQVRVVLCYRFVGVLLGCCGGGLSLLDWNMRDR